MSEIGDKIRQVFRESAVYKNPANNEVFVGRNLPSFVKDFILKKYINADGQVDRGALTAFLDNVIPQDASSVKDRLGNGQELTLLTRFIIYIDIWNILFCYSFALFILIIYCKTFTCYTAIKRNAFTACCI